jgi:hypothetical protein
MWQVVLGPFSSKDEADRCAGKVRSTGKGWWPATVQQVPIMGKKESGARVEVHREKEQAQ